ncbi:hypothetical protein B0H19DRAFT_1181091 [Mycena capillaripes]|nr:hypothetical protein B0H19DRAFT_1181091 [Mycena capillaripes]
MPISYLDILPVELWLACWAFSSTRQLRRLSLVCRLFRSLCLPILLAQQSADIAALVDELDRNNWVDRVHHLHRIAVRLDRLAGSSHVLAVRAASLDARFLRMLTLEDGYSHVLHIGIFNIMRDRVLATFRATIGLYQNMNSLSMRGITIDTALRQTLKSLSNLRELVLDECDITAPDGVLLKLQRFTISAIETKSAIETAQGSPEIHLVDPEHLLELRMLSAVQATSVFGGLRSHKFPNLSHLSLHPLFNFNIFALLERCPQLVSLVIPSIHPTSLPIYLSPHVVPLLRKITAPWDIVGLFASNRPIDAATVLNKEPGDPMTIESIRGVLIEISRSSATILSLGIPPTSSPIEALALTVSIFPALAELYMDLTTDRVRVLTCGYGMLDLDTREDTRCPELDDETAFDNVPADEISDSEDVVEEAKSQPLQSQSTTSMWATRNRRTGTYEEIPLPATPSGSYSDLLRRICAGLVEFPPEIAVLKLSLRPVRKLRGSWKPHEGATVAALRQQYPRLREVTLGSTTWEKFGR